MLSKWPNSKLKSRNELIRTGFSFKSCSSVTSHLPMHSVLYKLLNTTKAKYWKPI